MELYHVGYVVEDVRAAMAEYTAALGLTWAELTPRPLRVLVDDGPDPVEVDLLATYSRQGPPFVELIQELRGGVWTRGDGIRLDHVGYWEPDVVGASDRLLAQGCTQRVRNLGPDGAPGRFAYLRPASGGPWIELVDERVRPELMSWVRGSSYVVS